MPLTRKRATIWTCSDGTEFQDMKAACFHEHSLECVKEIASMLNYVVDFDNAAECAKVIFERKEEIIDLLRKSPSTYRREAVPANVEVKP